MIAIVAVERSRHLCMIGCTVMVALGAANSYAISHHERVRTFFTV